MLCHNQTCRGKRSCVLPPGKRSPVPKKAKLNTYPRSFVSSAATREEVPCPKEGQIKHRPEIICFISCWVFKQAVAPFAIAYTFEHTHIQTHTHKHTHTHTHTASYLHSHKQLRLDQSLPWAWGQTLVQISLGTVMTEVVDLGKGQKVKTWKKKKKSGNILAATAVFLALVVCTDPHPHCTRTHITSP